MVKKKHSTYTYFYYSTSWFRFKVLSRKKNKQIKKFLVDVRNNYPNHLELKKIKPTILTNNFHFFKLTDIDINKKKIYFPIFIT